MGKLDDFSLDQMAGAIALIISSFGGLLLIVFRSRCREIKCCYGLWSCIRELPEQPVEEEESVLPRTESQKSIGEMLREDEKLKEELSKRATEPLPEPEPST